MSKFDQIRATLVTAFRSGWPSGAPTDLPLAKVELPNLKFDRPEGAPWAALSIQQGGRESAAVGALRIRTTGMLFLQVFTPEDEGTQIQNQAGDHLAAIFDNQTLRLRDGSGYIRCGFVTGTGGLIREGYEQATWALPFEHDENR